MQEIFIKTRHNGYDTEQCGSTLTVKELIEILEDFNEDSPVYFSNDGGIHTAVSNMRIFSRVKQ